MTTVHSPMDDPLSPSHLALESRHRHPGPKTYVIVGAILAVLTLIEIIAYNLDFVGPYLTPLLLVLSAIKFVTVVGFFMHLRFDSRVLVGVFGFGFLVAGSIITALIFLFHQVPPPPIPTGG